MKTHRDLDVWKDGIDFSSVIYQITASFPKYELYGITSQIRNAVVSVPTNISEGAARNSSKEFVRFLHISMGSLSEVETLLIISRNLKYISEDSFEEVFAKLKKITAQLSGLIKVISKTYL